MSRIGKKQILIPENVTVTVNGAVVEVKGPKGTLSYTGRPEIKTVLSDKVLTFEIANPTKESNAYWGLTRALVANMIDGVVTGFTKELELVGVGYRVSLVSPTKLSISVGYSHPVVFDAPEGVTFEVEDNKKIKVSGIDKQLVGLTAALIRKVRKPEPYKGKGIKYIDEVVRRKAGKAGKA